MRILNLTSRFSSECRLLLVKQFPLMTRYRSCWLDPILSFPSSLENASQKMTGICLPALVAANTPGLFKSREQMNPMCMADHQRAKSRMLECWQSMCRNPDLLLSSLLCARMWLPFCLYEFCSEHPWNPILHAIFLGLSTGSSKALLRCCHLPPGDFHLK